MNIDIKSERKTNIYIKDRELWNWVKDRKNQTNMSSISDFIFHILQYSKRQDLETKIFLENIEKYYEYHHFDMDVLSEYLQLPKERIIEKINAELGKLPMYGTASEEELKYARKKIHNKMIEHKILPREFSIAYQLKKYLEKAVQIEGSKEIPIKELLDLLYPDSKEKTQEVYQYTINYTTDILKETGRIDKKKGLLEIKCSSCDKIDSCRYNQPELIYLQVGIKLDAEDIKDDLIMDIIRNTRKSNNFQLYSLFLENSIQSLIKTNYELINEFFAQNILIFPQNETDLLSNFFKGEIKKIERKIEKNFQHLNCVRSE